jgi:Aminoglycoside-2''-adenylyltransferase
VTALTPGEAGDLFRSFPRPWWVAGGWALDLQLGRETRKHEDVEIAVLRDDQDALREHLAEWELYYALDHKLHLWRAAETLELPIHEIWARRAGESQWSLELLLNECRDGAWTFRRDSRVTLPLGEAGVLSPSGLPVLAPQIVLLYKARNPREKDDADFEAVLSRLSARQREWLASALAMAEPGHAWIRALAEP